MNNKGYTKQADIQEEQRMIEEVMKDPESAEYFEELDRIYAFKLAANIDAWKRESSHN